ncbi:vWA domain-containing protein [Vibrio sp. MA40-2]|uniref:vWA domain-containing protein n=1 Tax=Vibrio sp. MA40-2 TaxID=3391828 RepID=UPI0039A4D21B
MKLTSIYGLTALLGTITIITACDKQSNQQSDLSINPIVDSSTAVEQEVPVPQKPDITIEKESHVIETTTKHASHSPSQNLSMSKMAMPQVISRPRMMPTNDQFMLQQQGQDTYLKNTSNGVYQVINTPLSTFSIDVDTGSYANIRSYLNMGQTPPVDAIREEAFINYFDYDYLPPDNKNQPFSINSEVAPSPWNEKRQLLRIGLQGYDIPNSSRQASNLVFLIDVSGSMNQPNKLPLLLRSLSTLVNELNDNDSVSLVTYAGQSQVILKPTAGNEKQTIINALKNLSAGGSTYGESGINLAYQQAQSNFIENGINRIILATDGDFNVGTTNIDSLKQLVATKREQGISLSTLGFGRGNYNDAMMEQLANIGDGNHAYIDTLHEAKKVLVRQMSGTLQTIASDVKIQIEFNPQLVKEYRLIGYQNRLLKDEDFNNDKVDAGEIGAGHTVTALYELTLTGETGQIDNLRYTEKNTVETGFIDELAQIKVRYKLPRTSVSTLTTQVIKASQMKTHFAQASRDFQFSSAVAAFAQKMKNNQYIGHLSYEEIADIARENRGKDPYNYRGEFISLVEIAQTL